MSTMEELINAQLALKMLMENIFCNYKKTGKDKRTKVFYNNRLTAFQKRWDEFDSGHTRLLIEKMNEKGSQKTYSYFENDVYSDVQNYFYNNYEGMLDRYQTEYPERTRDAEVSMDQSTQSKGIVEGGLKLPMITLEKFDGDYKRWPTFYDMFRTMVHQNDSINSVQKLQYLKMYLVGEPEQLLRSYQVTEKNYLSAWELLKGRYDNKRILVNTQLKTLLFQSKIQQESAQGIRGLLDTTSKCLQALENLDISTNEWDPILVFLIVNKLPSETHEIWEQDISKVKELPSWKNLQDFLDSRFRTLEAIQDRRPKQQITKVSNSTRNKSHVQAYYVASKVTCPCCQAHHNIRKCDKFINLPISKRKEIAKTKSLCFNCLSSGHKGTSCPSTKGCYYCKGHHHTLLHNGVDTTTGQLEKTNGSRMISNHVLTPNSPSFVPDNISSNVAKTSESNPYSAEDKGNHILLATALVKIVAPTGRETIVRALIDQGSQASFVTENIVQQLGLKREAVHVTVQGIGKDKNHHVTSRVMLQIQAVKNNNNIEVEGLVLKTLTSQLPSSNIRSYNWKHLEGLELADPRYYQRGSINLLLVADVFGSIVLDGLRKGKPGCPIAQKTIFGWMLSGRIERTSQAATTVKTFHLSIDLDKQLKQFWELEEIPNHKVLSEEEISCEEYFKKTTTRLKSGQYEVALPLKRTTIQHHLGKSRDIALQRLHQLENRFRKNPKLKEEYQKCLQEYVDLGHMIPVTKSEESCRSESPDFTYYECCYLPHHAVIKESSTTTKLRVVFDASRTTTSGVSLNEMLLKGPVVQDFLFKILIRWRKHRLAFTADIEKMYRQIQVKSSNTEFQRIVWREDPKQHIKEYKLITVTFGTKSAPYLATKVLQQLAIDEHNNNPRAAKIISNDFYVDDLLSGADSPKQAIELQNQILKAMNSAGLSLRKWASNCKELMENYAITNADIHILPFTEDMGTIKTLGLSWNTKEDTCMYSVNLNEKPDVWTKRKILSQLAKLFDPLGWLLPTIILAKMLMQRLWLSGSDWDDQVSTEIQQDWQTYLSHLPEVQNISIERWIRYTKKTTQIELHGFADASIKAYAGAVYVCVIDNTGERSSYLVASKTKVAPIKTISLPRLELCAATLVAKLIKYVIVALQFKQAVNIHAWTDSEIVLAWLKDHPSRWTTFVANRVSHIHEQLGKNLWNHVPSKQNPADCASRGMYPAQLKEHTLWWYGPSWLKKSKEHWSSKKNMNTKLESRKTIIVNTKTVSSYFETNFSSYTRLLRVVGYCVRFATNCKKKTQKESSYLKSHELQNSQLILLKRVQARHFLKEIAELKTSSHHTKNNQLSKLTPFLDHHGILRVTGRLQNSELSYNQKHPIILPDKDYFTQLLIEKTHKETLHGGFQLMATMLRENYWLINARNTIRHYIHKCIVCFRQKAETRTHFMGTLPSPRVQNFHPFLHTGMDYCGPFELKTYKGKSSKKYKAYICLFICMSIKAIHLELVTDLTSEGFIVAFRRFTSRRGLCCDLYSDNGTNFLGADKVLSKERKIMIDQVSIEIAESIETIGVKFHFNPPAAPHFGGLWEAGVKSTKYHLKRILQNDLLTYEEFTTVLYQIEACLNSRPLSEMRNDPQDLTTLTPAHFLIGNPILTPPEPSLLNTKLNYLNRWQHLQRLYQNFWKRWNTEYLTRLQQRPSYRCKGWRFGAVKRRKFATLSLVSRSHSRTTSR